MQYLLKWPEYSVVTESMDGRPIGYSKFADLSSLFTIKVPSFCLGMDYNLLIADFNQSPSFTYGSLFQLPQIIH